MYRNQILCGKILIITIILKHVMYKKHINMSAASKQITNLTNKNGLQTLK